jgi:hypothetical protein
MGSKKTSDTNQVSSGYKTEDSRVTGIAPYQQQFKQNYNQLANMYGQLAGTPITLERAPLFSNQADPIIQNMLSRGVQDIKGQQSQQQQSLANALSVGGTGNNSALLAALGYQGALAGAGAQNAMIPGALAQQREFDVQRQALIEARNRLALGARAQQAGELGIGSNLLQNLQGMAGVSAGRATTTRAKEEANTKTKAKSSLF